jgi:YidC/Oxa1 family membrane protein insertase
MWHAFVQWFANVIQFFYDLTVTIGIPNYGVAIILLTIVIKLVLFPLTQKQLKSMRTMQEMQPRMKWIQEKYKDDPQTMQAEIMKMYKEHGASPFSGCLPLIIQLPIFIAFYQALLQMSKTAFIHAANPGFLWIANLGVIVSKDPSITRFILPLLAGLTTYYQQKITMVDAKDPTQKSMLYFMPLMMAWIAYTVPAGLSVYWVMFNLLGILQQMYVNYTHGSLKLATGTGAVIEAGSHEKRENEPEQENRKKPEKNTEKKSSTVDDTARSDKGGKSKNGGPVNRKKRKNR